MGRVFECTQCREDFLFARHGMFLFKYIDEV
jgi:hypothetical protein